VLYDAEDLAAVAKSTPMGEDVTFDDKRSVLVLLPKDRVSQTYLDDILAHLQSAVDLFADETAHNFAGALRREIRILERTISSHAKRPVLILQDCRRVLDRLDLKEKTGELPGREQDADIFDFHGILTRTQLDLIALSPQVKAYHEATKPLASSADLALIADAAEIATQAGDDELAEILQNTADVLRDPDLTEDERRVAFYAAASRLSRMYRVAGSGPTQDVVGGKTMKQRIEDLRWFTSNPQVQDAIATIVRIFVGSTG